MVAKCSLPNNFLHGRRPLFGHYFWTAFVRCHRGMTPQVLISVQAFATWTWHNFLESENIGEKIVVRINMDESSCKLSPQPRRGCLALPSGMKSKLCKQIERRNPLKVRRSAVTLAAFISDDDEVNKALPQIIVGGEHVLQAWMTPLLMNNRTDGLFVLRRKSAWLNSDVVVNLVNVLGESLKPFASTRRFVLLLDAAKLHLSKKVVRACTRQGIYVMYVPASMTSFLQPLDTHVFSLFKRYITRKYEEALVNSGSGEVSTFNYLKILIEAVEHIIQGRSWKQAFLQTGFGSQQSKVSRSLRTKLQLDSVPSIDSRLPTFEELAVIYPSNVEPAVDCLFDLFLPERKRSRVLPKSFSSAPAVVDSANPWAGRLRSSSRLFSDSQPQHEQHSIQPELTPSASSSQPPLQACPQAIPASSSTARTGLPRAKRLFPSLRQLETLPPDP